MIEAVGIIDLHLWYLPYLSYRCIGKYMLKSSSVGLQPSLNPVISYNRAWQKVYCIAYLKESIVLSTDEGVYRVILDTNEVIHQCIVNV